MTKKKAIHIDNLLPDRKPLTKYPDHIKAQFLAYQSLGYDNTEISRSMGIPYSTIADWSRGNNIDKEVLQQHAIELKEELGSRLIKNAGILFEKAMDDKRVEKSSTLQLTTAASIMVDKSRLIDGESTENVILHTKQIDSSQKRIDNVSNLLEEKKRQLQEMQKGDSQK